MNTFELYTKREAEDAARIEQLKQHAVAFRAEHADALAAARAEYREALDTVLNAYARGTRNRGIGGYSFEENINALEHESRAAYMRMHEIEWPVLQAEWAVRSAIVKARRDAAQRAADLDTEDYSNATNERRQARREEFDDMYSNRDFSPWINRCEVAEGRANQ